MRVKDKTVTFWDITPLTKIQRNVLSVTLMSSKDR